MRFTILDRSGGHPPSARNQVFLTWDNWNDYSYYTLFGIYYIDKNGDKHELESLKIGFRGQETGQRVYEPGHTFTNIGTNYFSLGSNEDYYLELNKLGAELRDEILGGLNDLAKNPLLFDLFADEDVVQVSFFRSLSPLTVVGQFRRLADGGALSTPYSFAFLLNSVAEGLPIMELLFDVVNDSVPPTNVHALIGKNGVGKTYIINAMIRSFIEEDILSNRLGHFHFEERTDNEELGRFANIVSVSFSAFDEVELIDENIVFKDGLQYSYIGLRERARSGEGYILKGPTKLAEEFIESLYICQSRSLRDRWVMAITRLQSDPLFRDTDILSLIDISNSQSQKAMALEKFRSLSSGHKIILLTITKLIDKLQERSLVILDEPEAHLHPPLLSAFARCLSDLLTKTNGVAIVATHSPVFLQEIPRTCSWKLKRSGDVMACERLRIESFGENVGTLTSDIFGLEVQDAGFYNLLTDVAERNAFDYYRIVEAFGNQLGMEARSIIMALIAQNQDPDA